MPGARLIPLGEVVERIDEVPTDGTVYVICARGARSAKAVEHYRAPGHRRRERRRRHARPGSTPGCPSTRAGERGRERVERHHRHAAPTPGSPPTAASPSSSRSWRRPRPTASTPSSTASAPTTPAWRCCSCPGRAASRWSTRPWSTWRRSPTVLDGPGHVPHARRQPGPRDPRSGVCGTLPSRLFDTQVAAGFVGYSSVGLAGLVQGELGVKLPKADRLTDWLARPLPEGAVTYAAADVVAPPRAPRPARGQARGTGPARLGARRVRGAPHPHHQRAGARPGLVADQGGPVPAGPSGRGRAGAGGVAGAPGGGDRPAGAVPAAPTWRSWRWRSGPRPPRTTCGASAASTTASARGAPAASCWRSSPRGWPCPLEEVQVPPSEGVDRSRRAAASLVSAWAAQRARDLDIDAAILATRADIESLLMGDGGRLATRLAARRGGRADPGAGRRRGVAGRRSAGPLAAGDPLRRRAHRRMTAVSASSRPSKRLTLPPPIAGHLDDTDGVDLRGLGPHVHQHRPRVAVRAGAPPRRPRPRARRAPPGRRRTAPGCRGGPAASAGTGAGSSPDRPAGPRRTGRPRRAGRAATDPVPSRAGRPPSTGAGPDNRPVRRGRRRDRQGPRRPPAPAPPRRRRTGCLAG